MDFREKKLQLTAVISLDRKEASFIKSLEEYSSFRLTGSGITEVESFARKVITLHKTWFEPDSKHNNDRIYFEVTSEETQAMAEILKILSARCDRQEDEEFLTNFAMQMDELSLNSVFQQSCGLVGNLIAQTIDTCVKSEYDLRTPV